MKKRSKDYDTSKLEQDTDYILFDILQTLEEIRDQHSKPLDEDQPK